MNFKRVESHKIEFTGKREDHGANPGETALTARLAHMPWRGNTQGRSEDLFKHGGQTGRRQVRCVTVVRSIFNEDFWILPMQHKGRHAFGGFPNMIHGRVS